MVAGLALLAASVIIGSDGLLGAANLVIGISIQLSGPAWGGSISTTLGLLLLWTWWNRRRRRRCGIAALGAKSRTLRETLARRMAERTIPVPTWCGPGLEAGT
jgi:hypothetical protein